ncbi:acyltransferase family protein [Hominifimenecus sp. rT4P-3]|uniref:acyltransferase family protein n=1 Tax=Hominifimenecus sp. rT4P-3 TaxID=3242979 RepID=UPI003DA45CA3
MANSKNFAGIDGFRIVAAILVIAIHIGPFSAWNPDIDYLFSYCLARVAVPFFLMTTGYFVLAPSEKGDVIDSARLFRYLRRIGILYGIAILVYLPVRLYAKNLPTSPWAIVQDLIFDGTFYHLWYFPALITGCLILCLLVKKLGIKQTGVCVVILYLIGLLGDSYFGLVESLPPLRAFYYGVFAVSTYTRNGLFYVPLFLYLGMRQKERTPRRRVSDTLPALFLFLFLLLVEGFVTYRLKWQRHNSMYLSLIPCSIYLFEFVRSIPGQVPKSFRTASSWMYLIHPLVIVAVRGVAKQTSAADIFVGNSLVHFLTVTIVSAVSAIPMIWLFKRKEINHVRKRARLD